MTEKEQELQDERVAQQEQNDSATQPVSDRGGEGAAEGETPAAAPAEAATGPQTPAPETREKNAGDPEPGSEGRESADEAGAPGSEAAEPEGGAEESAAEGPEPQAEVEEPGGTESPAGTPAGAPATEEADAEQRGPRKRWYVIHTYSGHENKVKANLERAIQYNRMQDMFGEVLVVTEDYAVMKAGKKRITKRKTFPSYVLLEMVMNDETRALVQNIPGVTHFVGDRRPTPLTEAEVRRIRGQEVKEKGTVTTEVPFKIGESVKVMDGPFADFVGTVDEINAERGKLRVMVSIFGRPTAVELDIAQVTTI